MTSKPFLIDVRLWNVNIDERWWSILETTLDQYIPAMTYVELEECQQQVTHLVTESQVRVMINELVRRHSGR